MADGRDAVVSACGTYRYVLSRDLLGYGPPLIFCMLNPSTADATRDDPTIRRCIGFANREGARELIVINLYAFRSTNPRTVFDLQDNDPVGFRNDSTIRIVTRNAARVVCAWGAAPEAVLRARQVERMLRASGIELVCLGTTGKGMPRHPLYVKSDQPLIPYTGA